MKERERKRKLQSKNKNKIACIFFVKYLSLVPPHNKIIFEESRSLSSRLLERVHLLGTNEIHQ